MDECKSLVHGGLLPDVQQVPGWVPHPPPNTAPAVHSIRSTTTEPRQEADFGMSPG